MRFLHNIGCLMNYEILLTFFITWNIGIYQLNLLFKTHKWIIYSFGNLYDLYLSKQQEYYSKPLSLILSNTTIPCFNVDISWIVQLMQTMLRNKWFYPTLHCFAKAFSQTSHSNHMTILNNAETSKYICSILEHICWSPKAKN